MPQKPAPAFPGLAIEMTVEEIRAFNPEVVVLPLGSTEPHGPHLPLGTDTYQVTALGERAVKLANEQGARALLYPTLPITNNVNFRKFPFALRIGVRTLMHVIIDIVQQCKDDGVNKVVILNGHGGNPATIDAAMREIAGMDDMPFVCVAEGVMDLAVQGEEFKSPIEHYSDHGGEDETSRMMHLRPELVREQHLANNPVGQLKVKSLQYSKFVRPWHLYVPVSAGGETRKATPGKGKIVIDAGAQGLAKMLVELTEAEFDERFPYE